MSRAPEPRAVETTDKHRQAVAAVQRAGEHLGDALDSQSQALIDIAIERAAGAIESARVLFSGDPP